MSHEMIGDGGDRDHPSRSSPDAATEEDTSTWLRGRRGRRRSPYSDEDDDEEASPTSYSTCEGSDLDRYCSANSALGTASVCSSSFGLYADLAPDFSAKLIADGASVDVISDGERYSDDDDSIGECGVAFGEVGNPLLMNSAVAFGESDWDVFVQENGEDDLLSVFGYSNRSQALQFQQRGDSMAVQVDEFKQTMGKEEDEEQQEFREVAANSCLVAQVTACHVGNSSGNYEESSGNYGVSCIQNPHTNLWPVDDHVALKQEPLPIETQAACDSEADGISGESKGQAPFSSEVSPSPNPLCNDIFERLHSTSTTMLEGREDRSQELIKASGLPPPVKSNHDSCFKRNVEEISARECLKVDKVKKPNLNDAHEDMVLEMEEILLELGETHGPWIGVVNETYATIQNHPFRDGSSTASTSGMSETHASPQGSPKIDQIEITGAKQKKGNVSFGERLVGVKEYTVYQIRVSSGNDHWEIERRYRDFFALYKQLKILFAGHGLTLPSPWASVEQESKKFFGNVSPTVISERSTLIQDCLRSILHSRLPLGGPRILAYFLSADIAVYDSSSLKALIPGALWRAEDKNAERHPEDASAVGKTIALVVALKPHKSIRKLLELQHYKCAGCHTHLNAGKTLFQELMDTFKLNKPRFCEYTGQLFCASCHTNDTAVLPAKVLHLWDFSLYPVSQLAKAYLESIYEQPMLCVSAVNPLLFSKIPALLHVMNVRKKISAMFPYVQCPFRKSIERGLGYRRHLLESNDFFALRDLVDLSKGAFAALPVLVETIEKKLFEHITQQCLVCYDSGVPCAARQACDDPSSFIFPFQEVEAVKCASCGSIFHKPCFGKFMGCPCGKLSAPNSVKAVKEQVVHETEKEFDGFLNQVAHSSDALSGMFSSLFYKRMPDKITKSKSNSPVIPMSSLPSTYL